MFYDALVNGDVLAVLLYALAFFGAAWVLYDIVKRWRQ